MAARTPDEVLAELTELTQRMVQRDADQAADYLRRVELYEEARGLDPPVVHGRLAAATQVSEVAVIKAIKKARDLREAS